MTVGKRLYQYALSSKKTIIFALILLSVSVAAELTGPFIAKTIIDNHIMGIEEPWIETVEQEQAVLYNETWYIRESRLSDGSDRGNAIQIVQIGLSFYVTNQLIPFDGEKSFENGELTITNADDTFVSEAIALSASEVMDFYRPEIMPVVYWLLFYLGLIIFASFFQYGQRFYLQKAANRIIQKLRTDVFNHLSRLPVRFFDNLPAGKVVARVTNDTEAVRELYVAVLANFFSSVIYMIGIYTALFLLDARLAAGALVLIPILWVWIVLYRKFASKYNHEIRSKNSEINASLNESIQGMEIIQAFRKEKGREKTFGTLNEQHFTAQNKMLRLNSLTSHNLTAVLRNMIMVGLIWFLGGAQTGVGAVLTLGILYAFVDYINRLFEPINRIVNQLANLEQARVAGERVFELMDKEGEDVAEEVMKRPKGEITFDDVSFSYKEDEYVLKHLSFTAKPGQTIALVGHTGSGKSSIMNLLFRFYDCQKGAIRLDGQDIKDIPRQTLREHMGIVLQEPYLFTGTIETNITLNRNDITREEVEHALELVGGKQVFSRLDNILDEEVKEKGSTLSSGERQLISFARALVVNPAILVLDEATSNIDTETETIIQKAMDTLKEGRTTFIIAHRLSTIKNADQILVLDKGKIVEQGTHDELMKLEQNYAKMYQLQQQVKEESKVG
ncbi:multidrug ABC transporter permease [Alkalihalobacillus alcalophilus ATCC 27647 = CGMCC 1.3604]|uniref:Multidrug ABC transporter permease n=1 Tax=Alkalihalobacillus alcalophilus ATCC 27647 = CGMCC 1.3604 TaxID=1218173 RepID=J8TD05_ALKAL|nr:ABC transporter ATP-binding protein [Alkalihalobacillus alcalophilus]AFV25718.1 multidrug transporter [Alkalihalobacillus alcalophilus ATCC 27647 = CGMCC 1.3604]KGA97425.1 multidrug ABC transporter permease [Alkalihalobacillus alcalophilus ATCC 27647 = CGMCC 1.3604]MED1562259.1 ABC transporter ATP-binding protein [Alkalihalobacillus alcalophilus]THG90141.1 multidrug ABC transporter permease [Alkalihalobacillus alcalophilus ATCC 27647 = CGMCC 1.3604]